MKELYIQYNILNYFLEYYHKNKELKKTPKLITIKFNTFKCIINREKKNIQIYFNFSSIKEKTLFHYLKISSNILKLEKKYEDIITNLKDYKLYDSTIRLYQTNFRSHQVSFFFALITKKLVDFLEENKYINCIEYFNYGAMGEVLQLFCTKIFFISITINGLLKIYKNNNNYI